ncbi:MAG: hypothetical protein J5585_03100 [Clostridia bacterium]|nr:hypothetical protein [Clostridia bacterium]
MKKTIMFMCTLLLMALLFGCTGNIYNDAEGKNSQAFKSIGAESSQNNFKESEEKYDDVFQNALITCDDFENEFTVRTDYSLKEFIKNGNGNYTILRIVPENYEFYFYYNTVATKINNRDLYRNTEWAELECSSVEVIKNFSGFDLNASVKAVQKQYVSIKPDEKYEEWFMSEYGTKNESEYKLEVGKYYHNKEKLEEYGIKSITSSFIPVLMYGKQYYVFADISKTDSDEIYFTPIACCDGDLQQVSGDMDNSILDLTGQTNQRTAELIEMIKEYTNK